MQSDSKNCKDLKMAYIRVRKPYVSLIMNHLKAVQGKGHMPALDKSKFPFFSSALSRGSLSAFPNKIHMQKVLSSVCNVVLSCNGRYVFHFFFFYFFFFVNSSCMLYALNCVNYSLAAQIIFFLWMWILGRGIQTFPVEARQKKKMQSWATLSP